jgi:hypothetical protein
MRWLALLIALGSPSLAGAPGDQPQTAVSPPSPGLRGGDERPRLLLTWSTSSEVDNYGFFVRRADGEAGPFATLNEKALPGAGNSEVPRRYRYEDFAVVAGRTYYYYLESISLRGARRRFSPVISKTCCSLPAPGGASGARPSGPPPASSDPSPRP